MNVPQGTVLTIDQPTHDPDTGNVRNADSAPVCDVFLDASDTPLLAAQAMAQRSGKTGDYRLSINSSSGNGFTVGSFVNVVMTAIVTGTVSGTPITSKKTILTWRIGLPEVVTGSVPATVAGAVASVTGNVGGSVLGSVAGSVATVTDLSSTAQVELAGVPASTATIKDMIKWIFMSARNRRTQTSTTQLVKANDGSTTVGTSSVSDDGTTAVRGVFT